MILLNTLYRKIGDDMNDINWEDQYDDLEIWLAKKGYSIALEPGADDCIIWEDKIIYLNSRNGLENQYYTLLHECGHILIAQDEKQWKRDMPVYAISPDKRQAKSKAYRVSTVAEEIEAWKRGRRLSKRFGHYINDVKYNKQITDFVYTYIVWAAKPTTPFTFM